MLCSGNMCNGAAGQCFPAVVPAEVSTCSMHRVANMLSATPCKPQFYSMSPGCWPSGRAPPPYPLPVTWYVLSLPPRQPWPRPDLLPAEPRTPDTGAAFHCSVGSMPCEVPPMQTWKPPAAPGVRALLGKEIKREEVKRCNETTPGGKGFS